MITVPLTTELSAAETATFLLKVQRPKATSGSKKRLLIYSDDGTIPPTLVAAGSEMDLALGSRLKAWFTCTLRDNCLVLGSEVYKRE